MKTKLLSFLFVSLILIMPFRLVSQTNCLTPTGLTTTNITQTGATLSWTASTGALAYVVQYHPVTTPASAWINVTTQTTSVTLSNLPCGTPYEWQVAAYCGTTVGSISPYSSPVTFTTLACTVPCVPPTGLTTTSITLTGATLSWTAPSGALAYVVQYRPVTTPASSWTTLNATTSHLTLSNLSCGTQYEWQVATYCSNTSGVLSSYSTPITFTTLACVVPCLPPTGLTTTSITLTGATLSWTAPSGALAYVVQYRPVTTPASSWTTLNATTSHLTLSNLSCGTQYEWQVATYCSNTSGVLSSYSTPITFTTLACVVPCLPPTGLTTTSITLTGATLSWTAPAGALAYVVQYRPVTTPASTWINVTSQLTSVTLTTLTCSTQYEWQVMAYCSTISGGTSVYTIGTPFTTLACTPPCLAPNGLTTSNITQTGVTLSWTAVASVYAYLIQYRPVTTPASTWISTSSQTTSITLTSLTCGTQYEWQVATYCGNGVMSTYTTGTSFTTLACTPPCLAPTGLAVSNITQTGVTLSWTATAGTYSYYLVQYHPVTNPPTSWINVTSQTPSLTLTNLTCGTQYEWQVATYCSNTSGVLSSYSTSITFTTLACTVPCLPPTGLTTTNITLTGATLSWTASTGAVAYVVQYRPVTNPASAWTTLTAQTTSVTLSNLVCGSVYEWQVASHCSPNTTPISYSAIVTFTTTACITPCLPPTGLTTTNITLTGATLSWTASTGAIAYLVQYRPVTSPVSAWTTVNTQTNTTLTLSNLVCGTQYEWQVANYCSTTSGGFSSYSPSVTFTTLTCVVPCLPPTGLTTTSITLTGATLSWTAPAGALAYVVQYRPVTTPASSWITLNATTSHLTLSNLSCGTQYEWQVATYCSNTSGVLSSYSTSITFTTLACTVPCLPPTGLTTTNITLTGATLSWTASTGAVAYVVQYRPVTNPASAWTTLTAQTTSVTLSNLVCGSVYEWQVASHCSPNTTPISYSAIVTFTTTACITPCLPPTGLTTTNITLTGATLSWTASMGALAYVVQYHPVTTPASAWINVTTQTTSLILAHLSCGTYYEWRVASYCGNLSTAISIYSSSFSFSTLPCTNTNCAVPTGLTSIASNSNSSSRMLYWNSTNAVSYKIRYKKTNTAAYIYTTSSTNSKLISGLTSGQYEWQVQSICSSSSGSALVSAWSAPAYFNIPVQPVIFPNPVLNNDIHLPLVIEEETTMIILISDQFGHTIKTLNKTMAPGSETLDIDVADLRNGIYFIQIMGDNISVFQKIIILR